MNPPAWNSFLWKGGGQSCISKELCRFCPVLWGAVTVVGAGVRLEGCAAPDEPCRLNSWFREWSSYKSALSGFIGSVGSFEVAFESAQILNAVALTPKEQRVRRRHSNRWGQNHALVKDSFSWAGVKFFPEGKYLILFMAPELEESFHFRKVSELFPPSLSLVIFD